MKTYKKYANHYIVLDGKKFVSYFKDFEDADYNYGSSRYYSIYWVDADGKITDVSLH